MTKPKTQHSITTGAFTAMRPAAGDVRCQYCLAPATLDFIVVGCEADTSQHEYEYVSVCDADLLRAAQYCNDFVRLAAQLMFDGLGSARRDLHVRSAREYRAMLESVTEACARLELPSDAAVKIQDTYRERIKLVDEDAARATSFALDAGLLLEQVTKKIASDALDPTARLSRAGAKRKRKATKTPRKKKGGR